jgi:flavin-dependent dehydrogenase
MASRYDVIVLGARCAGSPTAMLLARKGYKVLLVDRATFPSDTPTAHFLIPPGVARLQRWGLLDRVRDTNCPPIRTWHLDVGPFTLSGSPAPVDGVAEAYAPRRTVLDKLLVDAAAEAGAEVREAFSVQELLWDGDQVTGLRGRVAGGAPVTETARLVVGADGLRSLVARSVQAPTYAEKPTVSCAYYGYWSGVPIRDSELYALDRRIVIAFPTNDALACIFIEWPIEEFAAFRADVEGNFQRTIDLVPGLAERVHRGQRAERLVGSGDLPNFFRRPYGPGWALVGDAGYHKDPYLAQGISDAFRDAEFLTAALDAGFAGRGRLEDALAGYERARNAAATPGYELNYQLARLEPPPPEMQQLFGALRGNQQETDQFFSALLGTRPVPEFFAPENVGRIVGAAPPGAT